MTPLILLVMSRLDRGIQSAAEMLPWNRGRGVARSCITAPPPALDADALVVLMLVTLLTIMFVLLSNVVGSD